jgi:hypothetical protein
MPSTNKAKKKRPQPTKPPAIIAFRLDPQSKDLLFRLASESDISIHDMARRYVLMVLDEGDARAELAKRLEIIHRDQQRFRYDFAFAVRAILTSAGKETDEAARAWVEKTITPQ